jgi:hypothetical protein
MFGRDTARTVLRAETILTVFILFDSRPTDAQDRTDVETSISVLGTPDFGLALAVNRAVRRASSRLADPACDAVFSDFKDAIGRTTRAVLDENQLTGSAYLGWLIFVNGSNDEFCLRRRLVAATNPGDRVVRLCSQFQLIQARDPEYAAVLVIHEELHSLGLSENPPSSAEITSRVMSRCADKTGKGGRR